MGYREVMSFNFDGIFFTIGWARGNASNVPFEMFYSQCVSLLLSSVLGFEQSMCVHECICALVRLNSIKIINMLHTPK